jgi:hypothetical protein
MLCTIEWMHENNQLISNNNLTRIFGEETKKRFNFYREIAIDNHDLTPGGIILTPKGQRIVDSWRRHQERIFSID